MSIFDPKFLQARRLVDAKRAKLRSVEADTGKTRTLCEQAFSALGATKLDAMKDGLIPFHDAFSKLHNVSLHVEVGDETTPTIDQVVVNAAGRLTVSVMDVVGATAAAGAAGVTASAATTSAVGAFATASTGTAISSLSGAAATNATLAWLGGGSLAVGGGGVALGAVVLGAVTVVPAVVVAGGFLHYKGRQALAKAEVYAAEVNGAVAKHRQAQSALNAAAQMGEGIRNLLQRLVPHLIAGTGWLSRVLETESDWAALDAADQERIRGLAALAVGISDLVHSAILDECGTITTAIRAAYDRGQTLAGEASV